jgi:hypothetical protein
MKPAAYSRHKYSADLYKFIVKTVGSEETIEYYFANSIALTAGIDQNQRLNIVTDEPMVIGNLLLNIKDRQNVSILGDMAWQISTAIPVLNAFGNVDSYKSRAVKYQGDIE